MPIILVIEFNFWKRVECMSECVRNLDISCNLSNDDRKPVCVYIMAVTTEHDLAAVISVFVTTSAWCTFSVTWDLLIV